MSRSDAIDPRASQEPATARVSAAAVALGVAYLIATTGGLLLAKAEGSVEAGWIATALALALLLRIETRDWPAALIIVFVTGFLAGLAAGVDAVLATGLMAATLIEIGFAAWLIRRLRGSDLAFDADVAVYLRVQVVAVLIAPALGAVVAGIVFSEAAGIDRSTVLWPWWTGTAMGTLLVLPVALSMSRARLRQTFTGAGFAEFIAAAAATGIATYLAVRFFLHPFVLVGIVLAALAMRLNPFATACVAAIGVTTLIVSEMFGWLPAPLFAGADPYVGTSLVFSASLAIVLPFIISLLIAGLRKERAEAANNVLRFDTVMQHSPIGKCVVGVDGKLLMVDRALCQMLGHTEDELRARTFIDVTHPDDREIGANRFARMVAGEIDSYQCDKRYVRKDGSVISGFLATALVRDETTGDPLYVVSQIQDVTERNRVQEALKASESRWAFALESARQGVWDVDVRGGKTFYSPMWKALLGYGDREIGDNSALWLAFVHPDDLDRVMRAGRDHFAGASEFFECDFRMRHKDGRWIWVSDRGRIVERDASGAPLRLIGTHTDITRQKQAEEEIRQLSRRIQLAVQAGNVGLWEFDADTGKLWWDPGTFKLFGIQPRRIDSTTFLRLVHPDDVERVERDMQDAIKSGSPVEREFRIVLPTGEIRRIVSRAVPVASGAGPKHQYVGMCWDVTEQRLRAETMREERERFQIVLDSISEAVVGTDAAGRITFISRSAAEATGWTTEGALGIPIAEVVRLFDMTTNELIADPIEGSRPAAEAKEPRQHFTLVDRNGNYREVGAIAARIGDASLDSAGAVLVFASLRPALRRDALTGTSDRGSFEYMLQSVCEETAAARQHHAVCYIRLDGIESVQLHGGTEARDALLREIATLITTGVRAGDVTGRLDDAAFGLLLRSCPLAQAEAIVTKLGEIIGGSRFAWEGRGFAIEASVGIAELREGASPEAIIRDAEAACRKAGSIGEDGIGVSEEKAGVPAAMARAG